MCALAMTACASSSGGATGPSVTTKAPSVTAAVAWHNAELHAVGQPIASGGLAVALIAEHNQLFVVGVDPATGAKRWQQPTTPSWVTVGEEARVTPIGDAKIAYLRPTRPESLYPYAELVVADARTGADVWKTPDALFTAWPVPCSDDKAVCSITEGWDAPRRDHVRLDLATGASTVDNSHIPLRAYVVTRAPLELLDLADFPDNTLGLLRDGRLQWHVRFSELFPRDFKTFNGARWHRYHEVVAGSIWGATRVNRDGSYVDLERHSATVGLVAASGKQLWHDRGSALFGEPGDPPVRVRAHGRVVYAVGQAPHAEDLDAKLEGFDPATGKTLWAVDLGASEAATPMDAPAAIAGPTRRVFHHKGGATVVDYASGATAPAAPGATFWCRARARYAFPILYWRGVHMGGDTRQGGLLAFVCDDHGAAATMLPAVEATAAIGAQASGYAVIATAGGLIGIQAPAEPAPAEPAPPALPAEPAPAASPAPPPAAPASPAPPAEPAPAASPRLEATPASAP